jgi:hypothetical protein
MKKLSILFASFFIAAFVITSCTKVETSEGTNELGKATITGKVYMNYNNDLNKPGATTDPLEFAPAGTQVIATINAIDLAQDDNGVATTPKKSYYTTVDANGEYTFSIDAGAKNVAVTIELVDVMQARTYYFWNTTASPNAFTPKTDTRTMWSSNGGAANVIAKQNVYLDLYYNNYWFVQD